MSMLPLPSDPPKPAPQARVLAETVDHDPPGNAGGVPPETGHGPALSTPAPPGSAPGKVVTTSLVGTSFGDFDILAELGRGGMGVVYQARQKSLDRLVALKMLLGQHFQDPVRLARFVSEARASASLNHPNIVQVYQVGECQFGHYFAMEYIEGQSLEALLRKGKLTILSAVSLVSTLAEAVHYAHTRMIIHRDLKPANIMIDSRNRPVIMDFGIAKVLGTGKSLTQQGVIMGTPGYMAPEQAGDHHELVGPHSDVYSLAAILYTLLTGRVPYDEGTPLRTILKVIGPEMPPAVRDLRPEVPERLERICMKGLSKEPAARYPSAFALGDHLRRYKAKHSQHAGPGAKKSSGPAVVLVAKATGKQLRLTNTKTIIGRSSECEVVLRSADVSKQHCQLISRGNEVWVEDLASANGIQVNGRTVKRARLQDRDVLTIVRYDFEVRILKPPV